MIRDDIQKLMIENLNESFKDFDKETIDNLFEVSLNSLNSDLENLKEAIKNRDKEKIIHFVHSMKGVFLNLQCNDLAEDFNDKKLKNLEIDKIIEKVEDNIKKIT